MRPLTLKRLLWTCGALAAVLLACVVLALKLGAVPISVTDLVVNLGRIAIGRSDQLPTEYRLIIFELRLPRILLGVLVGAALSVSPVTPGDAGALRGASTTPKGACASVRHASLQVRTDADVNGSPDHSLSRGKNNQKTQCFGENQTTKGATNSTESGFF